MVQQCVVLLIILVQCVCSLKDPLLEAVVVADVSRVKQLLQLDRSILSANIPVIVDRLEKENNRTALLQCGLDPQTTLLKDLDADCALIATLLLKNGANVHHTDKNKWNAVAMGSTRGLTSYISVLADHGANINNKDINGRTPFMKAVTHGHLDTTRKLVDLHANICDTDKHGWSALHFSVRQVVQHHEIYIPVLEYISAVAAQENCLNLIDEDGRTPLMYASLEGILEAVDVLLRAGADSRIVDRLGYSAYDLTDKHDLQQRLADAAAERTLHEHEKWRKQQMEKEDWSEL